MPKHEDIYKAVREAVEVGLQIVRAHKQEKKYFLGYYEFPNLGYFATGLPHITTSSGLSEGPFDYKSAFRDEYAWDKVPEWKTFIRFAKANPVLSKHFVRETKLEVDPSHPELAERFENIGIGLTLEYFVD